MIRSVAERRAGPWRPSAGFGKIIGSPNRTTSLPGFGRRAPTGWIRSVPRSATGTTGAPEAMASHATPVRPRYNRPSLDRLPSGWMPNAPPPSSTRSAASSDSCAARYPPRGTGMASMPSMNARVTHCLGLPPRKYSSLARNDTRRGVTSGMRKLSTNDRWLAARMTGPTRGTFPAPCTSGRKAIRDSGSSTGRSMGERCMSALQMCVDGGDQQRLGRAQTGHHLQRSPVPELRDPVEGGPERRGRGGGLQQFLEYAEERRAFVPESDVVTAQQVMPEHEGEHAGLVPCEVDVA